MMETKESWKAPGLVPSLAYRDVPAALQWLGRVFGFRERLDARLSWKGGCLAWMELGDVLVNLTTEGGHELRSPQGVDGVSVALKVYVDDVDKHFHHARGAGAIILCDPQDGFWGGRIYRVKDLEGHHWEFSQRGRDLDAAEWRLPPGLMRGAGEDPRPPIWVGHVVLESDRLEESARFMLTIGMRPVFQGPSVAIFELRGGTHLVLVAKQEIATDDVSFDLMVEDLRATHRHLTSLGMAPTPIEAVPDIDHERFQLREPAGHVLTFYSNHVSGSPV